MFTKTTKILITDDSRVMRLLAHRTLSEAGYTSVLEAENGQQALELINQAEEAMAPVQLLMLDVNMPVLSGIELVKKLKAHSAHKNIPIIMISSEGEQEFVDSAYQLGINDHMVKPITGEELLEAMNRLAQKLDQ